MPDLTDPVEPHRSWAVVGIGAGLLTAATIVARSATRPGGIADALAEATVGQLILVALCGLLVGRAARHGRDAHAQPAARLLAGSIGLALVWGAVIGRAPLDPSHVGIVGAPGSSTALALVAVVLVFGWSVWVGGGRSTRLPSLPTVPAWVLGGFAVASVVVSGLHPVLGGVAAAFVALLVPITRHEPSSRRSLPTTRQLVGAAVGLAVAVPATFEFIAAHNVERLSIVDGSTRLAGPLATPYLWTVLIAVSVGVAAAGAVELAVAAQRRVLTSSFAGGLISLAAVTFLVRVATLVNVSSNRRDGDRFFYHVTANLLARGRGFEEPLSWVAHGTEVPSALHGPAYPVVLSVWSRIGGTSYFDHQLASVVLGVPQVVFGVMLARLLAGRRAAVLAAVLLLVYPNIWITDGILYVESMMAGLTTAATWIVYRWRDDPRVTRMVIAGVLIGVAALTRGEAVLLVALLLPVVFFWGDLDRRRRIIHAGAGALACVLTLVPWAIYNQTRFEVAVPLSTNSNEVLYYANCEDSYYGQLLGYWAYSCQDRYRQENGDAPGDQAEKALFWRELAIDYVGDHLDRVPVVVAARVGRQWELFRPRQMVDLGVIVEGRPKLPLQIGLAMFYPLMALSVAGSFALRKRRVPIWPLWCHAVAVTLTAIYAYGTLRFRAPFEPIMCVMAAIGLVALWDRSRPRRPLVVTSEERP